MSVFLMVFGPGDDLLSKFGHTALWIQDETTGTGKAYNYGMSIGTGRYPGTMRSFIRAEVQSRLLAQDPHQLASSYAALNRSVTVQELNLDPSQRLALREFLESELETDHEVDFFLGNCTTEIRNAIDRVMGGRIRAATADLPSTGGTYRTHSLRYLSDEILLFNAMVLGLGSSVDAVLTRWEELFLPETLRDFFRQYHVQDESGTSVPFVVSEETWYVSDRRPTSPDSPTNWSLHVVIGVIVGSALAALGARAPTGGWPRAAFTLAAGAWLTIVGTLGITLLVLWGLTDQHWAYRNENLLYVHPLAILLAWMVLSGPFTSRRNLLIVRGLAIAMACVAVLGVLLEAHPLFRQANGAVMAILIPAHLGLAWGLWRWPSSLDGLGSLQSETAR